MKNWLLYFFVLAVSMASVPFAADRAVSADLPALTVSVGGNVTEMTAEEYALRIVLAESGHCENTETKKALAVSARSVALYLSVFGCKHSDFDVCDDKNCCFALGDPATADQALLLECQAAVDATFGLALTVDNLPAMALFTLCAGSGTGDCAEFTYLPAVAEDTRCGKHITESEHNFAELQPLLPQDISYDGIKQSSVIVYAANSKCAFGVLGGKYMSAAEIVGALSLKSNEFSIEFAENTIKTTSYGIGHGYGLSLCGAETSANSGAKFEEILINYYPELTLKKMYHN